MFAAISNRAGPPPIAVAIAGAQKSGTTSLLRYLSQHPQLSGQAPLEIARIGSAWRIRCTGCGEASPLVQFRWQVLDQTVPCRCD